MEGIILEVVTEISPSAADTHHDPLFIANEPNI
jgi:hypothetical protein